MICGKECKGLEARCKPNPNGVDVGEPMMKSPKMMSGNQDEVTGGEEEMPMLENFHSSMAKTGGGGGSISHPKNKRIAAAVAKDDSCGGG